MAYGYHDFDEPSRPRAVRGGIKAQSRRGDFGQNWWARRWIEVLESFEIGARLGRGRSYARRGQVLSVDIKKGAVQARVQGSRPNPYAVEIGVKTLTDAEWGKLAVALSQRAIFAANLLAGQMPENIEEAFRAVGLSLFPGRRRDLQTDCSCPDWSNPCKHIAAVYYLLGEEFDRDPFLIFRLRGIEREELIGLIERPASEALRAGDVEAIPGALAGGEEGNLPPPEALPAEPEAFWAQPMAEYDAGEDVYIPSFAAALPRRLGSFPFWRGEESFLAALEEVYRQASPRGLDLYLGEYRVERSV